MFADEDEVYVRDRGDVITPAQLPTSLEDLRDDPFRRLAGAVREACGFTEKRAAPRLRILWNLSGPTMFAKTGPKLIFPLTR